MSDPKSEPHWSLDKKVPLALLIFLAVQDFGAGWYLSSQSARVDQLERQVATTAPYAERIIRVEAKVDTLVDKIAEIKGIVSSPREPVRR